MKRPGIMERFWSNVNVLDETSCWEWFAHRDRGGYGRFRAEGSSGASYLAHRFSYELAKGPIEGDLTVDHCCFNRSCVNPNHLRLLTRSENAKLQQRMFTTHCANGHEYTPETTYRRPRTGHRACVTCRAESKQAFQASFVPKVLPPDDARHGTGNGYDYYRCRCDACKAAHGARMATRAKRIA